MIRIHLKICRSCRQSPGAQRARFVRVSELSRSARESADTRAPNALSAGANEAFKIIVCFLMCDGQDKPRLGSFI